MAALIRYFSADLITHLIIFQGVMLLITLGNIFLTRRARNHQTAGELPSVSILVPARNEEDKIAACALSLLKQDYPEFEVVILDDHSTDGTGTILKDLKKTWPSLRVLAGQAGPADQTGKNWACSQLYHSARGELLLFTDADTIHSPLTLRETVNALRGEDADLISGYPRQILGSWGERFLVPFFSWAILVLFPLGLGYRIKSPIFTTAVGQMMLFRREAYQKIGGHAAVSSSIVDDLSLAREIHKKGLKWRVVYLADLVSCRMYKSTREALEGFAKNLFAAFEFRLIPFLFAFAWLGVMFLEPLLILILKIAGRAPAAATSQLAACILLSAVIWIISYLHLRLPIWLALLYPLTTIANGVSAARSLLASLRGELVWKDRVIQAFNWKWF